MATHWPAVNQALDWANWRTNRSWEEEEEGPSSLHTLVNTLEDSGTERHATNRSAKLGERMENQTRIFELETDV